MQQARMIGNYVEHMAETNAVSNEDLCKLIGCGEYQLNSFFKGRSILSFSQLSKIASKLGVTVSQILKGDEDNYNKTVVHCMNEFDNVENREKILDIIDDYMDIYEVYKTVK